MKEVIFSPSKCCPSNLSVQVSYFYVGLSTNRLTLPALCLSPPCIHPTLQMHVTYTNQLVERLRFTSGTLLTFPFSLSPPLSPILLLFSLLSVAAAERLYSQLERNRLLSNELKLTLHDLCD